MAKRGRPSKLVPERVDKLLEALRIGNYIDVAVVYAGISADSFYNWMELGQSHKEGKYFEFLVAVKKAQADAEARQVALVSKAAIDTWQAAAWMLERKHPEKWGNRPRIELTGKDGGPIEVDAKTKLIGLITGVSTRLGEGEGAPPALQPGGAEPTVRLELLGKTEPTSPGG